MESNGDGIFWYVILAITLLVVAGIGIVFCVKCGVVQRFRCKKGSL